MRNASLLLVQAHCERDSKEEEGWLRQAERAYTVKCEVGT
jgi:hypothetical protein